MFATTLNASTFMSLYFIEAPAVLSTGTPAMSPSSSILSDPVASALKTCRSCRLLFHWTTSPLSSILSGPAVSAANASKSLSLYFISEAISQSTAKSKQFAETKQTADVMKNSNFLNLTTLHCISWAISQSLSKSHLSSTHLRQFCMLGVPTSKPYFSACVENAYKGPYVSFCDLRLL